LSIIFLYIYLNKKYKDMKNYFTSILLLVLITSSCDTKKNHDLKNNEIIEKSKYQLELIEIFETKSYYSIILDKTSGKVFVGENSTNWYEATHEQPLPKSNENRYSLKVRKVETPKGVVPQIILFDENTSEIFVYVVNNVANFYPTMSPFDVIEQ
jgi:hypothetical protein